MIEKAVKSKLFEQKRPNKEQQILAKVPRAYKRRHLRQVALLRKRGLPSLADLQNMLNSVLGIDLDVDGAYGPKTRAAIIKFQSLPDNKGMQVDGVIGRETFSALNKAAMGSGGDAKKGTRKGMDVKTDDKPGGSRDLIDQLKGKAIPKLSDDELKSFADQLNDPKKSGFYPEESAIGQKQKQAKMNVGRELLKRDIKHPLTDMARQSQEQEQMYVDAFARYGKFELQKIVNNISGNKEEDIRLIRGAILRHIRKTMKDRAGLRLIRNKVGGPDAFSRVLNKAAEKFMNDNSSIQRVLKSKTPPRRETFGRSDFSKMPTEKDLPKGRRKVVYTGGLPQRTQTQRRFEDD
jgi:hypothetical protein